MVNNNFNYFSVLPRDLIRVEILPKVKTLGIKNLRVVCKLFKYMIDQYDIDRSNNKMFQKNVNGVTNKIQKPLFGEKAVRQKGLFYRLTKQIELNKFNIDCITESINEIKKAISMRKSSWVGWATHDILNYIGYDNLNKMLANKGNQGVFTKKI